MTEGCVAKEEILQAHTQLSREGEGEFCQGEPKESQTFIIKGPVL